MKSTASEPGLTYYMSRIRCRLACPMQSVIFSIGKYNHPSFHAGCVVICYTIDLKDLFEYHSVQGKLRHYLSMTNKVGHHGGHFTELCRGKTFTHFIFLDECRSNNL